jgi:hypothetical protein
MSRWVISLTLLVGCFILAEWLPFSSYFRNVDTMVHEFGHALTTLVLSGQVQYIELYEDHSGVTLSTVREGWQLIPIALSGYMVASLFALVLFYLYRRAQLRLGLFLMMLVAAISLMAFVRNEFGAQWLIGFIGLNALAFIIPVRWLRLSYYLLLSFLTLVESVYGTVTILLLSLLEPEKAGDAATLAQLTGIPAVFWGGLFLIFSLWVAMKAVGYFVAPPKRNLWAPKQRI